MAKAAPKKKDVPATTGSKEVDPRSKTWFRPGQSGNPKGRPEGSRNRLTENFLREMADDFAQHGKAAIVKVREEDPSKYLSVVAQLVPKETDVNLKADDAFVKVWQAVASGTMAAIVDQLDDDQEGARH